MTKRTHAPSFVRSVGAVVCLLLIVGCGGTDRAAPDAQAPSRSLDSLYRAAIADARTAEPSEIVTTLTPIAPYNDDLVWRQRRDATRRVLVVTWGDRTTLPAATPGDTLTAPSDVWVTAAPHLQEFCRALDRTGSALDRRLAQRLGLPPDVTYDRFIELWVRPAALVRPCPDPEVTDRECERRAPVPARHAAVSEDHRAWFRALKRTSYGPDGYPFTGLGYTYDWHPGTDEVGPSEFVLRTGQQAIVHAIQPTAAYCRPS